MGKLLKSRGLIPDRIVCSPAVRAGMTARLLADAVGYELAAIETYPELYEQGVSGLMTVIHGLNSGWTRVYLIGHNPDLSLLVNRLTGEHLGQLPTCGVASLVFDVEHWPHIMEASGRLSLFDYPKRYSRDT
jgi:phosphohistidine phosphatase